MAFTSAWSIDTYMRHYRLKYAPSSNFECYKIIIQCEELVQWIHISAFIERIEWIHNRRSMIYSWYIEAFEKYSHHLIHRSGLICLYKLQANFLLNKLICIQKCKNSYFYSFLTFSDVKKPHSETRKHVIGKKLLGSNIAYMS